MSRLNAIFPLSKRNFSKFCFRFNAVEDLSYLYNTPMQFHYFLIGPTFLKLLQLLSAKPIKNAEMI